MKKYLLFFCFLTNFACAVDEDVGLLEAEVKGFKKDRLLGSFLFTVDCRLKDTTSQEIDAMLQELRFHVHTNFLDEKEVFEELYKGIEGRIEENEARLNIRYDKENLIVGGTGSVLGVAGLLGIAAYEFKNPGFIGSENVGFVLLPVVSSILGACFLYLGLTVDMREITKKEREQLFMVKERCGLALSSDLEKKFYAPFNFFQQHAWISLKSR